MTQTYPDKKDQQFIAALSSLKTKKEVESFLRDVFTLSELKEAANRLEMARLLWSTDKPYLEIAAQTNSSTTTVTRVAEWLFKRGLNGYQTALKRLFPKQKNP